MLGNRTEYYGAAAVTQRLAHERAMRQADVTGIAHHTVLSGKRASVGAPNLIQLEKGSHYIHHPKLERALSEKEVKHKKKVKLDKQVHYKQL